MGAFSVRIIIYISDLLKCAHSTLTTACQCLTSETASLSSGFFVHHRFNFACMRRNYSPNIANGTTNVKDTSNNSSKYFAVTNIRENICGVSVPVESIIPCNSLH